LGSKPDPFQCHANSPETVTAYVTHTVILNSQQREPYGSPCFVLLNMDSSVSTSTLQCWISNTSGMRTIE